MNKPELISTAAERAGIAKKDADRDINAAIDIIAAALERGEKVQLTGFGTFEVAHRKAKVGRNLQTRETVQIPATRVPTFKPSQGLKDKVSK